ncbi:hypothetical protein BGZ59_007016 [Podila verticillata]|nr:hypothetical protein BGZ59_007016 [Podila verticillata]
MFLLNLSYKNVAMTKSTTSHSAAAPGNSQSKTNSSSPGSKKKWSFSFSSSKMGVKDSKDEQDPSLNGGVIAAAMPGLALASSAPLSKLLLTPVSTKPAAALGRNLFPANVSQKESEISLPKIGDRIKDTPQLVLCASLVKTVGAVPPPSSSTLTLAQLKWIRDFDSDPFEKAHLYQLMDRMVDIFIQQPNKDSDAIREIVLLGPVLDRKRYRKLLDCFLAEFKCNTLLDDELLQGLVQLIQSASEGYLVEDDLVKIMSILRNNLQNTHQQSSDHSYYLTLALSRVLDVMARHEVKNVARVEQHEPLEKVLRGLRGSSDPFLLYQASYAFQALQFITDDETNLQAVLRRSGAVAEGLVNITGVLNLDLSGFLKGLGQIQKTTADTIEVAKTAYEGARSLIESGQDVFESIEEGINSRNKRAWYPAIIGANAMVREGRLHDFKVVVLEAACRKSYEFQWESVQGIPFVERDVHRLKDQRRGDYKQNVYTPPLAKASLQAYDEDALPLMDRIKEFLGNDQQVFLVLGDSGAGKSTFNRYLEHVLWEEYNPGDAIPLFVNLPAIDRPDQHLIRKQLQIYELFSDLQIQEIKRHRRIILICDGYDEAQLDLNLHDMNHLNQNGQPVTKMIISCRSTFIEENYRHQFQPKRTNLHRTTNLYAEAVITPFSRDQIEDYVCQFVQDSEAHKLMGDRTIWSTGEYMNKLKSIPNMMELVKNPFLLKISLRALPGVVEGAVDLTKVKVTRLTLYDSFVNQWLAWDKERLTNSLATGNLSGDTKKALKELLAENFEASAVDFLKDLANSIFREQDGIPVVQFKPISDRETWKAKFFSPEPGVTLLRDSSPLSRAGNKHRFIHRSLLEYFYSRHIHGTGKTEDKVSKDSQDLDLANHPLSKRNLVKEPSIVQFLAEHVQGDSDFENQLHQIIEQSKTDSHASQAAANAITILVRAGVRFNGADLKGIRIRGADLSFGVFDSADLQGADLQNTYLQGVWLRQAKLNGAYMDSARFGEWPALQDTKGVFALSPDGETFATSTTEGSVRLYFTSTWTVRGSLTGNVDSERYIKSVGKFKSVSHVESVSHLKFSPDGLLLATGGDVVITGTSELAREDFVAADRSQVLSGMAFSPDGKMISTCGRDASVITWDTANDERLWRFEDKANYAFRSISYSPNGGRHIACAAEDGTVKIFDTAASAADQLRVILVLGVPNKVGHAGSVLVAVFSEDGTQIATAGMDKTVRLWNAQTGVPGPVLRGHLEPVRDVIFLPNRHQIASSSDDGMIRFWDMQLSNSMPTVTSSPNEQEQHGSRHIHKIKQVLNVPGSQHIASCSSDSVRIWHKETGELCHTFRAARFDILVMAVSPCGGKMAIIDEGGTLRRIDLPSGSHQPELYGIG